MKLALLFAFEFLLVMNISAQKNVPEEAVYLSVGRIAFGTGDFFGYAVNVGYSKTLNADKKFLSHFSGQLELSFEYGNEQPKVMNPTFEEFVNQVYYSTANIAVVPKIGYYPFKRTFLKGINLTGGLLFGYTNQNREFEAMRIYDTLSQTAVRRSYLEFINQFTFGYRISAGYEYPVTKHFLAGARMDFENYTNLGDINTTLAITFGYQF